MARRVEVRLRVIVPGILKAALGVLKRLSPNNDEAIFCALHPRHLVLDTDSHQSTDAEPIEWQAGFLSPAPPRNRGDVNRPNARHFRDPAKIARRSTNQERAG